MSLIEGSDFKFKRVSVIAGHYGSGKTNIAVNFALRRIVSEGHLTIADLDIVNPYYRTKDSAELLERNGITLISSEYANTNVDVPALPAAIYDAVLDDSRGLVIDVGGDDRGAMALGRYSEYISREDNYDMFFVINMFRPLTKNARDTLDVFGEVEAASGLKFSGIINNSNLGPLTTAEDIASSAEYAAEVCELTGLPLFATTVSDIIAEECAKIESIVKPFPLSLQRNRIWLAGN